MSKLPPLSAVRVFEAAARLENFTVAAAELGMTQAAVSYQIKLLEERLGISLFHRMGRKVALTDKARVLAPVISRAFDEMRTGFAALTAEDSNVLTISSHPSLSGQWLVPRLGDFQRRHPELAVRLDASDRLVDFAREGVDVALRGGLGDWPGLESRRLLRNRIAPLCSPGFIAQHGPIDTIAQMHDLPRLTPEDSWWASWFAAMGHPAGGRYGRPEIALYSQQMEGRAAMAGQGLAILSVFLWRQEMEAGLLVEPMPSQVIDPTTYWLVHPPHSRNVPKVKAFRDWIIAQFAAEAAPDG